jgi:biotin transport system substrate-specific component
MADSYESVELVPDVTVRYVTIAVLLAALTAVLAQVSIPLPGGIPFSLQPFPVFFAGLILGPVWGGFSLSLYLLAGLAGAPVFSNGGAGVGYLLGPTGGFLVGFLAAAVLIGALVHRGATPKPFEQISPWIAALALVVALVPIYAAGVPWFAEVQGWTLTRAGGFMAPYAFGDLLKVAISVGIVAGGPGVLDALE